MRTMIAFPVDTLITSNSFLRGFAILVSPHSFEIYIPNMQKQYDVLFWNCPFFEENQITVSTTKRLASDCLDS